MASSSPLRPLCNGVTPSRRTPKRKMADGKENSFDISPVTSDRNLKDISHISKMTSSSFREQPSTADLSGNFQSTFNYPLHSTLNYPLSSTFRVDGPGEGLEVTADESTLIKPNKPCQRVRSRTNKSRRVRAMVNQAVRDHLIEAEVDCDCDSSVLTDLSDLENDPSGNQGHPPPPSRRVLKRQTGQAVLHPHQIRPPVALSRSDFLMLDETLKPHFDVDDTRNISLNATRGSIPDLDDVIEPTERRSSRRKSSHSKSISSKHRHRKHSRHNRHDKENIESMPCMMHQVQTSRRMPTYGQECEPDSGVSCSSRHSLASSGIRILDKPSRSSLRSSAKCPRKADPSERVRIKTLGVF